MLISSVRDVTERKRAHERLAREVAATAAVTSGMLRGDLDDAEAEKQVLDGCLAATDSAYGFIGEVNDEGTFDVTTYGSRTRHDCAFPEALAMEM
ncbi:MAG: hypothetical protein V1737_03890, partial [Chloroflexota bacterium]